MLHLLYYIIADEVSKLRAQSPNILCALDPIKSLRRLHWSKRNEIIQYKVLSLSLSLNDKAH